MSFRGRFFLLALLTFAGTAWVVYDESVTRRPWKRYQARFQALAKALGRRAPAGVGLRQITNAELGIVDRCQSCHLGVDRAGFDDKKKVPAVFRTHPLRATLLGKAHPTASFGCTSCHDGQGPQTKGVAGAAFDHGRNDHYWERPMKRGAFVQSSCAGCHREEVIPHAPVYNRGRRLFVDKRCYGCHQSQRVGQTSPAGPPLLHLAKKTSRAFVERWIADPRALRPMTRMPRFWPVPRDPKSQKPLPKRDPRYQRWNKTRQIEVQAIAAFLGQQMPKTPLPKASLPDDLNDPAAVARGKTLFDQAGCRGCHTLGEPHGASFGPALDRVGEKASAPWLAAFLANPKAVWPKTVMPNLKLAEKERHALVCYLVSLRTPGAPPAKPRWPKASPAQIAAGEKAVLKYGCHGCHRIAGLERAGRAGPDLSAFGDKPPRERVWGAAAGGRRCDPRLASCWTQMKIRRPRAMANDKIEPRMPEHRLSTAEAEALAVYVLGQRRRDVPARYRRTLSKRAAALQAGEALIARLNCRGCHEIGRTTKRVLDEDGELLEVRYTPKGGAALRKHYPHPSLAPPPLTFAGEKFQYPWLATFLASPRQIRPQLLARMPVFSLSRAQIATLVRYFALSNKQPYPFANDPAPVLTSAERDDAIWLFRAFQCVKCHQVSSAKSAKLGELAPDLALTAQRLRPGWLRKWLRAPQFLQPGTKMPTFFPLADDDDPKSITTPYTDRLGGDVNRQIDALIRVNWRFGVDADLTRVIFDKGKKGSTP